MTFRQDITGMAVCRDGVISVPKIAQYLPFKEKKDYAATKTADGSLVISLV